jgi:hypothetical protein
MARDFDGTNDNISFGSDASIDGFTSKFFLMWIEKDVTDAEYQLIAKDRTNSAWGVRLMANANSNVVRLNQQFSGTDGAWSSTDPVTTGLTHIAMSYNGSATTNDPDFYINGVFQTTTELSTPTGTIDTDAAVNLLVGESGVGTIDFNGAIQNMIYGSGTLTAAQVNRHRWWGRIGGATAVQHPLLTTKLTNEGTATANGTATGTAMRSLPRTVRPGCG